MTRPVLTFFPLIMHDMSGHCLRCLSYSARNAYIVCTFSSGKGRRPPQPGQGHAVTPVLSERKPLQISRLERKAFRKQPRQHKVALHTTLCYLAFIGIRWIVQDWLVDDTREARFTEGQTQSTLGSMNPILEHSPLPKPSGVRKHRPSASDGISDLSLQRKTKMYVLSPPTLSFLSF